MKAIGVLTKVIAGQITSSSSDWRQRLAAKNSADVQVDVANAQPWCTMVKRSSRLRQIGPYPIQPEARQSVSDSIASFGMYGLESFTIPGPPFLQKIFVQQMFGKVS
jgi:hypothetical protein